MTPSAPSACTQRRFQHDLIDRHFARRITPTGESSMRSHLPDCPSCRRYYERHMILAEVLPSRPRMADRLAVGLGLAQTIRPPKRRQWKGSWTLMTAGAAVACVAVLVARVGLRPADDDFVARGAPDVQARPQIEVYRVAADGSAGRPSDWMSPADELAFAYRNP
ncbi:MAG: hypothetical protein H7X95_06880, partial [Deltaproteobacteria bacterium]|nr:hypothetical protein [Deltaproteobacteria bacterium]